MTARPSPDTDLTRPRRDALARRWRIRIVLAASGFALLAGCAKAPSTSDSTAQSLANDGYGTVAVTARRTRGRANGLLEAVEAANGDVTRAPLTTDPRHDNRSTRTGLPLPVQPAAATTTDADTGEPDTSVWVEPDVEVELRPLAA